MDWPESNLGFWHFPRRHNKDFIRTPIICRPCPSSCAQSWWSPRATHWWGWWWGGDWLNRISLVVIWNSTLGGLTAQISGTWHSLSQPLLFSNHDAHVPHYDDDVNELWQAHLCGQFPPGASHLSAPAAPLPTLQPSRLSQCHPPESWCHFSLLAITDVALVKAVPLFLHSWTAEKKKLEKTKDFDKSDSEIGWERFEILLAMIGKSETSLKTQMVANALQCWENLRLITLPNSKQLKNSPG